MTFEEFAATRMPGVLRFAAVLAGDRATAEDLAQEVLIRAYYRWDRIGALDRPEAYVRKMMLNEYLSWRRRSSRQVPAGATDIESVGATRDHPAEYTEREALLGELGKLLLCFQHRTSTRTRRGVIDARVLLLSGGRVTQLPWLTATANENTAFPGVTAQNNVPSFPW